MTHSVFMEVTDPDALAGDHPAVMMADGITEVVYQQIFIPHLFTTLLAMRVFIVTAGTGNMVASVDTTWGQVCASEVYNQHTDSMAVGIYPMIVGNITCVDVSAAFTGIAHDDLIGIAFTRVGGHASDTVNANCYYLGTELEFAP